MDSSNSSQSNSTTTLIFDADDTLWDEQGILQDFEKSIAQTLIANGKNFEFPRQFEQVEERNIPFIGYGFSSYTFNLVEALSPCEEYRDVWNDILLKYRNLYDLYSLNHPIVTREIFETLKTLHSRGYSMHILSRGIPSEQQHKIEKSGLKKFFNTVSIVQKKDTDTYQNFCTSHDLTPSEITMIGNSLRSDILPAVNAGCKAIWIPTPNEWAHDKHTTPAIKLFHKADQFSDLLSLLPGPKKSAQK